MKGIQGSISSFLKKEDPIIIPIFLVLFLLCTAIFDIYQKGEIFLKSTLKSPLSFQVSKYPIIKDKHDIDISAKAAVIMDRDSKVVIYSKNDNLRFSPASTTKIMTALVAVDYFKLADVLEVRGATSEGSILGLLKGEKITFENLLYAMLLPSANDAAFTISQNYPGGTEGFVEKMNQKAKLLNLNNTHFQDPAGLLDQDGYTTPLELARLASVSLDNKIFSQIVSTQYKSISDIYGLNTYSLLNRNKLLGMDGINGIKTGFTDEAGGVLVTSKKQNGHTLIIVVMKSDDRFGDTLKVADYLSGNLTYLSVHP